MFETFGNAGRGGRNPVKGTVIASDRDLSARSSTREGGSKPFVHRTRTADADVPHASGPLQADPESFPKPCTRIAVAKDCQNNCLSAGWRSSRGGAGSLPSLFLF